MIVVSDTSPIRALHHLDLMDLLREFFGDVIIPPAVHRELIQPQSGDPPVAIAQYGFVAVRAPSSVADVQRMRRLLDPGESEAIALALELHADAILIDEAAGRAAAEREGLKLIGALGVLLQAKQRNRIPLVRPLMDRLRAEINFFISDRLYQAICAMADE